KAQMTGKKTDPLLSRDFRERSVSPRAAVTTEAEVKAGIHNVLGLFDTVDESPPVVLNESEIPSTKVVVIVLDEASNKVGERVLTADADCPAATGVGHRTNEHPVGKVEFVALPSAAALYIAEEAIPPITEAPGHRGQRIYFGVIHEAGEHQAGITARISAALAVVRPNATTPMEATIKRFMIIPRSCEFSDQDYSWWAFHAVSLEQQF